MIMLIAVLVVMTNTMRYFGTSRKSGEEITNSISLISFSLSRTISTLTSPQCFSVGENSKAVRK